MRHALDTGRAKLRKEDASCLHASGAIVFTAVNVLGFLWSVHRRCMLLHSAFTRSRPELGHEAA